jgi:hypothetical protein
MSGDVGMKISSAAKGVGLMLDDTHILVLWSSEARRFLGWFAGAVLRQLACVSFMVYIKAGEINDVKSCFYA